MIPHNSLLYNVGWSFINESYADYKIRYKGFGKDLYEKINEYYPEIFRKFFFYRRLDNQQDDSYAVCANGEMSFAIQLNFLSDTIVLWNEFKQFEIGTWADDEYCLALQDIRDNFL